MYLGKMSSTSVLFVQSLFLALPLAGISAPQPKPVDASAIHQQFAAKDATIATLKAQVVALQQSLQIANQKLLVVTAQEGHDHKALTSILNSPDILSLRMSQQQGQADKDNDNRPDDPDYDNESMDQKFDDAAGQIIGGGPVDHVSQSSTLFKLPDGSFVARDDRTGKYTPVK